MCVKLVSVCVSDLDVLQPVGGWWGGGQGEVVSGCHPGLQALQLSGGSVSGHMTHQVALELVWQEVEVDRHRVARSHVPERDADILTFENASFLSVLCFHVSVWDVDHITRTEQEAVETPQIISKY